MRMCRLTQFMSEWVWEARGWGKLMHKIVPAKTKKTREDTRLAVCKIQGLASRKSFSLLLLLLPRGHNKV